MNKYLIIFLIMGLAACKTNSQQNAETTSKKEITAKEGTVSNEETAVIKEEKPGYSRITTIEKVNKTPEEWKAELNDLEYYVLREKGTERPFTGDLLKNKKEGYYTCRGCDLILFSSETKYDSGTGWPSFYEPYAEGRLVEATDYDIGYPRTELTCARCGGHQGHVFEDGPKPTGLRYCINSIALNFKPDIKR